MLGAKLSAVARSLAFITIDESMEPAILTTSAQPVRPSSPGSGAAGECGDWRDALKSAIRDPAELCQLLGLPESLAASVGDFPMLVPRGYAARMQTGDPNDPLLRQVLPVADEHASAPGFGIDPVGDLSAAKQPGLLQKYRGRVLLVLTGACAVNCRYCFRRHYPYATASAGPKQWLPALEQIALDESITEVILSGGDPLVLSDELLAELIQRLNAIPHLQRLRIHTRLPIVVPQRVTDALAALLSGLRQKPVVVIHANHAHEIDSAVEESIARLSSTGALLLNQAVLLRGVNNTYQAQADLCEKLVEIGVLPYYLHQLDRVAGAAHFGVEEAQGHEIIEQLRARLPGYAVPRYVQETAGEPNKVVLA